MVIAVGPGVGEIMIRATTEPKRMALPLAVISPSHSPKVPSPDAYAA